MSRKFPETKGNSLFHQSGSSLSRRLLMCLAVVVLTTAWLLSCGGAANPSWQTSGPNASPGPSSNPAPNPAPSPPPNPPPNPPPDPALEADFSLVLLPDTQHYSQGTNGGTMEMMRAEMRWIVAQRTQENIRAVIGLGDIVQCGSSDAEWANADSAYDLLDADGIPYVPTIGNHDYDGGCGGLSTGRSAVKFNEHFGPARLSPHAWYGNSRFPAGSNENFFVTFEAGNLKFLVVALEFYPRDAALAWAQQVVDEHADRRVIVVTHACVNVDNTRILAAQPKGPLDYGLTDYNDGESLWQKFVRPNPRVFMVVNGHLHGVGRLTELNQAGEPVHQMLSNYQAFPRGGDGYLRILRFRPAAGRIDVRSYSPFLDQSYTDDANQFSVSYTP